MILIVSYISLAFKVTFRLERRQLGIGCRESPRVRIKLSPEFCPETAFAPRSPTSRVGLFPQPVCEKGILERWQCWSYLLRDMVPELSVCHYLDNGRLRGADYSVDHVEVFHGVELEFCGNLHICPLWSADLAFITRRRLSSHMRG